VGENRGNPSSLLYKFIIFKGDECWNCYMTRDTIEHSNMRIANHDVTTVRAQLVRAVRGKERCWFDSSSQHGDIIFLIRIASAHSNSVINCSSIKCRMQTSLSFSASMHIVCHEIHKVDCCKHCFDIIRKICSPCSSCNCDCQAIL
jgi:hypothetical protein